MVQKTFFIITIIFFQISGTEIQNSVDTDYEDNSHFKLMEIPQVINIFGENFVIAGAIIFIPPLIEGDIGHYVCANKINNQWEIIDDNDSKTPRVTSSKSSYCIHALMYVTTSTH